MNKTWFHDITIIINTFILKLLFDLILFLFILNTCFILKKHIALYLRVYDKKLDILKIILIIREVLSLLIYLVYCLD